VDLLVDLSPAAEHSALARNLARDIRENVSQHVSKQRGLGAMRGAVCLVADDTGEALTLRFDFGRLVIHAGVVGIPDLTIRARSKVLERLPDLPAPSLAGARRLNRGGRVRRALTLTLRAAATGDLRIYGGVLHLGLLARFWLVVSKTA
jgi:hypothetical protein